MNSLFVTIVFAFLLGVSSLMGAPGKYQSATDAQNMSDPTVVDSQTKAGEPGALVTPFEWKTDHETDTKKTVERPAPEPKDDAADRRAARSRQAE